MKLNKFKNCSTPLREKFPKGRAPTESSVQRAFVKKVKKSKETIDDLKNFTAIGHQGKKDAVDMGVQRKLEGVEKGFPDMALFVPSGSYSGFFMELKLPWGSPDKDQKDWNIRLNKQGYLAIIVYTIKPSVLMELLITYIKSPEKIRPLLTSKTLDCDIEFFC